MNCICTTDRANIHVKCAADDTSQRSELEPKLWGSTRDVLQSLHHALDDRFLIRLITASTAGSVAHVCKRPSKEKRSRSSSCACKIVCAHAEGAAAQLERGCAQEAATAPTWSECCRHRCAGALRHANGGRRRGVSWGPGHLRSPRACKVGSLQWLT